MAYITVSSGQTVNGYDVINEFFQVYSGGSVSATTVGSSGFLQIYTGGTATGSVVTGQGFEQLRACISIIESGFHTGFPSVFE